MNPSTASTQQIATNIKIRVTKASSMVSAAPYPIAYGKLCRIHWISPLMKCTKITTRNAKSTKYERWTASEQVSIMQSWNPDTACTLWEIKREPRWQRLRPIVTVYIMHVISCEWCDEHHIPKQHWRNRYTKMTSDNDKIPHTLQLRWHATDSLTDRAKSQRH